MKNNLFSFYKANLGKVNIYFVLLIAFNFLQAVLMVLFALSIKNIINLAVYNSISEVLPIIKAAITSLLLVVFAYACLYASKMLTEKCRIEAEKKIRQLFFSKVLDKEYSLVSSYKSGELISRVMSDTSTVARGYSTVIPTLILCLTKIVLVVAVLIYLQPLWTVILLCVAGVIILLSMLYRNYSKKLYKNVKTENGKATAFVTESFNNLLAVKAFGVKDKFDKKAETVFNAYAKAAKKQKYTSSMLITLMGFSFIAIYLFTIVWGAIGLYNNVSGIDFGVITAMIQLVSQIQSPLINVSGVWTTYFEAIASKDRLDEILNLCDEMVSYTKNENSVFDNFSAVKAEGLSFNYGSEAVFNNASFCIKKGEIVLIKGSSGIGKTTLLKLLLGVYKSSGEIYFERDNVNQKIDESTRSYFSYVPQGNLLFSGTIKENLCFLNENATDKEIEKAVMLAAADIFINELPDKLNTVIGERGEGLSEGQKQRISIARALLTNKPILLLDEATSALDEATETTILSNIKNNLGGNITVFIVSHRTNTEKIASSILTVENKLISKTDNTK